jgi:hypothetical protein
MKRALLTTIVLTAGLLVAACGDGSTPRVQPDVAAKPTWGGCQERSMQNIDYLAGAKGARTRAAAVARYRVDGDRVVVRPARPHRNAQVLMVDDHNVIHHALEVWHTRHGWLVSTVETCAG